MLFVVFINGQLKYRKSTSCCCRLCI